MIKQTVYNIADSNIANLGSDLEKKVKLESAQVCIFNHILLLFLFSEL